MLTSPTSRTALRGLPAVAALLLVVALAAQPVVAGSIDEVPVEAQGGGSSYAAEGDSTVHDITFPLPAGSYAPLYDSYDDPRGGGRVHRANDLMADKMTTVHAVVDGEIIFAPGVDGEAKPSYGYMIRLAGDDGMFYSYVHLNDDADPDACDRSGGPEAAYAPGIREGVRVQRGDVIGYVGSSGNASCDAPHLHFEIGEDSRFQVRHNPMASLEAAEERGDFPDSIAPRGSSGSFSRLAGDGRVTTALVLSQETYERADAVVVVPAESPFEALVAAPLAGLLDAPVLLSGEQALPGVVRDEVERLGASRAYVVGSTDRLAQGVVEDLADAGVDSVERLAADSTYALAAVVAAEVREVGQPVRQVVLALGDPAAGGRAWPDALSASAYAAGTGAPVLLTGADALPDAVRDALQQLQPQEVVVVGGTAAITEDVAEAAAAAAGPGASARRLAGPTRYATSVAVADHAMGAGLTSGDIWVATGLDFPDALAAGPAAAAGGSPLVLIDGRDADGSPASADWLARNAERIVVVGGSLAVSDAVAAAVAPPAGEDDEDDDDEDEG